MFALTFMASTHSDISFLQCLKIIKNQVRRLGRHQRSNYHYSSQIMTVFSPPVLNESVVTSLVCLFLVFTITLQHSSILSISNFQLKEGKAKKPAKLKSRKKKDSNNYAERYGTMYNLFFCDHTLRLKYDVEVSICCVSCSVKAKILNKRKKMQETTFCRPLKPFPYVENESQVIYVSASYASARQVLHI